MKNKHFYLELKLSDFIRSNPDIVKYLPAELDLSDDNYIIRITDGIIEIGYLSDDWKINV